MKGTEKSFSMAQLKFEQLEDLEADDFRQEAKTNSDDILSQNNLMAPKPSIDKDFADKNDLVALYFAAERRDDFQPFSEKELEDFALKALKEDKWLLESPYFLEQRKENVKKHVEEIWTNRDDERLSRLAKNKIKSLTDRGKKDKLREISEEEYDSKKELLADYSLKYDSMVEEHVDREDIQRKRGILEKTVKKGLELRQPDSEDIKRFSEEAGLNQLSEVREKLDEDMLDARTVRQLSEDLENISDREQKRGFLQALKAIRQQASGESEKALQTVIRKTESFTPNQNIREALKEKGMEIGN